VHYATVDEDNLVPGHVLVDEAVRTQRSTHGGPRPPRLPLSQRFAASSGEAASRVSPIGRCRSGADHPAQCTGGNSPRVRHGQCRDNGHGLNGIRLDGLPPAVQEKAVGIEVTFVRDGEHDDCCC
jgi:hypothetical protein